MLQQQQHNFSFGAQGEQRAQQFLLQKQFQILDTNVRFGSHEVDIVALDTVVHELVFIEVKTRTTSFFGDPSLAVNRKKVQSMQIVARKYLGKHPFNGDIRFDAIAVLPTEIEHFENITW